MDTKEMNRIIKEARSVGRAVLVEPEAKELLELGGITVPRGEVVKDVEGALEAAERLSYPVVLKIVSPDILHKSEVSGVALDIRNGAGIEDSWAGMILGLADEHPMAMVQGFLVEEMVPRGAEVIVGVINDEQFGPVVMFGVGGLNVELLKDVSFRLAPITRDDAMEMMQEVKTFPLLAGFRGATPKDLEAIAEVMVKLVGIVEGTDGIGEIEINPLIVYERGAVAVDARAILAAPPAAD